MAFGRTNIIVPVLAVLAGFFGAYKLWQNIDEHLEDVEAEVTVENVASLEALKDECTFASTSTSHCSAGSPLHPPSLHVPLHSSPSSDACSASHLALRETNTCDDKGENIHEIISARSTSPVSSLINPASSSVWNDGEPTSAPLTITEIQKKSIGGISATSRLTITDLSSFSTTLSQELKNELKMEIENMKTQLPTHTETFIVLQMGRKLGGGTFGRVYEADTRFQKIAVKVLISNESAILPASASASASYMSMHEFYSEALLLSNLNHPNILSFEFIISQVSPYDLPGMATEFMSDDLHNFIRNAGVLKSWNDVWSIAMQVANGLKYLHSEKIIHFDLKSSNILLSYSGSPIPNIPICKVGDFGLAIKNCSGTRPNVPNWCDIGWKGLMEDCWSEDQDQRPSFDQIVERFSKLLGAP